MKRFQAGLLACTAALLLSACTTIRELPSETQMEPVNEETKLCRALLMTLLKEDSSGFAKLLAPDQRTEITPDRFRQITKVMTEEFGTPVSFQYLTKLEMPVATPYLWKVRFRKKLKNGDEIFRETLFRIVTGKTKEGTAVVLSLNYL